MLLHQLAPDDYVPVFDSGQARVDVLFLRVGLGRRENPIQVGGIRLVLPMMLEGVGYPPPPPPPPPPRSFLCLKFALDRVCRGFPAAIHKSGAVISLTSHR